MTTNCIDVCDLVLERLDALGFEWDDDNERHDDILDILATKVTFVRNDQPVVTITRNWRSEVEIQKHAEVPIEFKDNHEGYFPVTFVHRTDLEESGIDSRQVTDDQMVQLGDGLGESYVGGNFWQDIVDIGAEMKLATKPACPTADCLGTPSEMEWREDKGKWLCHVCKKEFEVPPGREPKVQLEVADPATSSGEDTPSP